MHVPSDAFQGMSPEVKASQALKNLFTMVAVRVVIAEEKARASADDVDGETSTSRVLREFLKANPMRDGNEWLRAMVSRDDAETRIVALRLLEVRKAYADEEFDFERVRAVAIKELKDDNDRLMSDYVKRSMGG